MSTRYSGSVDNSSTALALRPKRYLAPGLCVLALAGCGGGSGENGGQAPDPVVLDLPIAYINRPLPVNNQGDRIPDDALQPAAFNPGAELIVRERASPEAPAVIATANMFPEGELYDVKDLEASYDGEKLLFALRAPEIPNVDDDEQPTWNIWEYELATRNLRRIISSDITADAGQDVGPHYLADGRIIFSSTRQRQTRATLLDEGKPQYSGMDEDRNQPAFVLHVMDSDGTNIRQLSFNQSHDLHPTLLESGDILFSRWDNAAGNNSISLYKIHPDGSNLRFVYGYHSQNTGINSDDTNNMESRFLQPREMPDGQILVALRPQVSEQLGGDIVLADTTGFTEKNQPVFNNAGSSETGHKSAAFGTVFTDGTASPHGHFSAAYPLHDGTNRLLVSWSQCRLQDPNTGDILACTDDNLAIANIVEAPPLYGIWSYDLSNQSQLPIVTGEEGRMFTDIVALEPRPLPTHIPDATPGLDTDIDLANENVGTLHIRSVYDLDGADSSSSGITVLSDPAQTSADQRPARFLRIVKAVPIPDDDLVDLDNSAFGRSTSQLMREIIGYTPIEPDGSVKVKVPANIPFALSVLDSNGRRLGGRHNNWLQLMPGEERECNGCHTANSNLPHGRPDAEAPSVNNGAATTGLPFPNTEPALFADMGETMAETFSRINGVPEPTVDIEFSDYWTDPTVRAKDPDLNYRYVDLVTAAPTTLACQADWNSNCRIVINYETHIQPLWERDRRIFAADGITLQTDNTCITCHNIQDNNGMAQIPAGQLDLRNTPSTDEPDQLTSYRELLFNDNEQELVNNALQDRMVQATDGNGDPLFLTDDNGELILDVNGNPIPVMVPITVAASMSVGGALASPRFFSRFNDGGSHQGYLDAAELRLLSEWLDIGGQYYNNPFDVPLN